MNDLKLSVLVVSYNTRVLTEACLQSLVRHCPDAEVIVVDNASQDGSAQAVRERLPNARLVELPVNEGFAGGNNAGLGLAGGEYILFLNSDTVIEDDSLTRLAVWMDSRPGFGAVSPRLIGPDGLEQQCLHPFPSLRRKCQDFFRLAPNDKSNDIWLAGTCLMIRRQALDSIGGRLDDRHFMYWEDADLSNRLTQAGWKLAMVADCHVHHWGGASGGGADSSRRPDLHAWYIWGRLALIRQRQGWWVGAVCSLMEWLDVGRKIIRGLLRFNRWAEVRQALAVCKMLWAGHPSRP